MYDDLIEDIHYLQRSCPNDSLNNIFETSYDGLLLSYKQRYHVLKEKDRTLIQKVISCTEDQIENIRECRDCDIYLNNLLEDLRDL